MRLRESASEPAQDLRRSQRSGGRGAHQGGSLDYNPEDERGAHPARDLGARVEGPARVDTAQAFLLGNHLDRELSCGRTARIHDHVHRICGVETASGKHRRS